MLYANVPSSYAHCRKLARRADSSFYLSFFLLPRAQRDAMCALYAFLRRTDDIADGAAPLPQRRRQLHAWRQALRAALAGSCPDPLLPALIDCVRRFEIPGGYLFAAIDGAEMDLDRRRCATFAELEQYCHCVASVVGLACLCIWGCRDERAVEPARQCGLAFQMTNILRDVAEDARRGRIYLPLEDLARCGCREEDILKGRFTAGVGRLIDFQIRRARGFYDQAQALDWLLPRGGRRAWRVMTGTYRTILDDLQRCGGNVFEHPVRLTRLRRIWLAARGLLLPAPREKRLQPAIDRSAWQDRRSA